MQALEYRSIQVEARDGSGRRVPAMLALCGQCQNESFRIYVTGDAPKLHQHIQCERCSETYCGTCSNAEV